MAEFDDILGELKAGQEGRNHMVPMGFHRLNKYIGIRKKIMTLVFGATGCLSKGTKVIMIDGSMKSVEDIQVGDLLMGPDSLPRHVQELKRGIDQMYWIRQNKGIDYRVNSDHILHLRKIRKEKKSNKTLPNQLHIPANKRKRVVVYGEQKVETVNISVKDVLNKPKSYLHDWLGYKTSIKFCSQYVGIDPYLLGLWLGDGTSTKSEITSADKEIVNYINDWADSHGCKVKHSSEYRYIISANPALIQEKENGEIVKYGSIREAAKKLKYTEQHMCSYINKGKRIANSNWNWENRENSLLKFLQSNNLIGNKYIPNNYLRNSKDIRLQLLAGIIDTDGSRDKNGGYSITLKSKVLSDNVVYLCRSLGFYTSIVPKMATMKREDDSVYSCIVYRITINGNNLYEIPCRIARKKFYSTSKRVSDALSTGIRIEEDTVDYYYGFTLSGDGLFLLEDTTITHNSGKSSLVYDAWILNPFDWYMLNKHKTKIKVKPILFSFERSKIYTKTKWLSRKIFKDHGIMIPIGKILGWWEDNKLTHEEHDYILMYEDYINELCEFVTILEGANNPTGYYKYMKEYAETHGEVEQIDEHHRVYHPANDHEIVIPIVDHIGLTKLERSYTDKKQAIDKLSEYAQLSRDFYGYSPVFVAQLTRELGSVQYQKMGEFEPSLDQVKESGAPGEAADVVMSLFDPLRYNTRDMGGYAAETLVNTQTGAKHFRSVKLLKNTYGEDSIRCGMAFHGATGMFAELPKRDNMTPEVCERVINGMYFLDNK